MTPPDIQINAIRLLMGASLRSLYMKAKVRSDEETKAWIEWRKWCRCHPTLKLKVIKLYDHAIDLARE